MRTRQASSSTPLPRRWARITRSSARQAVVVLTTDFAWSFWLGVVLLGLLTPLALEWVGLVRQSATRLVLRAAASLVLLGGFLLRYVVVYAGQASGL